MDLLGVDYGQKKVGLARGESDSRLAFVRPALLVASVDEATNQVVALVKAENFSKVIVGRPIGLDGSVTPQTAEVETWVTKLRQRLNIPVELWDERLSSVAVQKEQQAHGRKLARGEEDSLAAQLMLESYLQHLP